MGRNFHSQPLKVEQDYCGVIRAVSVGFCVFNRKEWWIRDNSLDRPIDTAVCGGYTKHLWSSSIPHCIQAAFSLCCGPGGCSPVFTHWQNHFLQELRSHERGQRGCWPVMKGPLPHTSPNRQEAGFVGQHWHGSVWECVWVCWHLSSHSFLQPFIIQFS